MENQPYSKLPYQKNFQMDWGGHVHPSPPHSGASVLNIFNTETSFEIYIDLLLRTVFLDTVFSYELLFLVFSKTRYQPPRLILLVLISSVFESILVKVIDRVSAIMKVIDPNRVN